ncbi:hypothetical protein JRQ81_006195 [Phrynocephalus forsythii]|uniref:Uncharacterized protein n=1 Tax=Phrynocephalus forsythii TaxID=171643 RepID=A0A9Q0Y3C5_9SAUR|nr:hypothetical protein JRQ81_006195 [Phrynocephalus forsythii]
MEHREDVTWYLKASQVALALAIIRSKPPDKSSKEYAEHLAKRLLIQLDQSKERRPFSHVFASVLLSSKILECLIFKTGSCNIDRVSYL